MLARRCLQRFLPFNMEVPLANGTRRLSLSGISDIANFLRTINIHRT